MEILKSVTTIDFMGKRNICIIASAALILAGIVSLVLKGGPDLGVEFTGGVEIQLHFKEAPSLDKIRAALGRMGQGDAVIQQFGEAQEVLVRLRPTDETLGVMDQAVARYLSEDFPRGSFEIRRVEAIGPAVSRDLMKQALWAISLSLAGILVYVGLRFKIAWGVGGVVALLHDLMVTIGLFSLLGREWSLPVVAAFLTIAGFSINDTIVVFDRMRENLKLRLKDSLPGIINLSVNQTLSRTVITNGTVFVVTLALFVWGGEVLRDFSLALVIGVIAGTYSTVFIAAPIVVVWHGKKRP